MTLFQIFPFLSSGGFISHVPESTLRVSYCVPYIAFITHQHFLLTTDCVVPSFYNATNNVTVRHTVTHWKLCMGKIICKLYPYLCNSVKRGHKNCKKENQNIANLVTKQKFIFWNLELSQIPAFMANSGASLKDNVKKKMKFVHYNVIWQNDLGWSGPSLKFQVAR